MSDFRRHGTRLALAGVLAALAPSAMAAETKALTYMTDQQGGITVIDQASLTPLREISVGGGQPRGLAVTDDGKFLLTANKDTGDLSVIDRATEHLIRAIPIGANPEFVRALGHLAYVTYEPASEGKPADGKPADGGADDLAHIAIVDLDRLAVITSVASGKETEGVEFSADGRYFLVTNEGDNTVSVFDRRSGASVTVVKIGEPDSRPRGIKRLPDGSGYVVSLELTNKFVILDKNFAIVRKVDTLDGPYGVAFDPAGKRLFVAAARAKMIQVFDAHDYTPLAQIPVGQRCWHFTFSAKGETLLVACGRSGAVFAIDAATYQRITILDGFKMPWGVVSYPRASGSLE